MTLDISNNSWELILSQAEKYKSANLTWQSPKQAKNYRVNSVSSKKIVIDRIDGGEPSTIGQKFFLQHLAKINEKNGKVPRSYTVERKHSRFVRMPTKSNPVLDAFGGHVAKMAAIVQLHPQLFWSDDHDWILVKENSNISSGLINSKEIPNDIGDWQFIARRIRRWQGAFRDELLKQYNSKCCISGTDIDAILDAAHIYPHCKTLVNNSTNGLLLRSDLHDLFDSDLIAIHPSTHVVHIHPKIAKSEYGKFHLRKIAKRKDEKEPSTQYLERKWDEKGW